MFNATTCMDQHLEQISDHVHRLFHASFQAQGERDMTAELTRIWNVTCELRRAMATPAIVEGYRLDALDQVRRVGELIAKWEQFVREVVKNAREVAQQLAKFKQGLAADMQAFLDLSAEKYGVTLGGVKGNINLASFDGSFKVLREVSERLDFDERLQAAKALIDECLREWTRDSGAEVRTLIEDAFQVDKKGRINTQRILGLRRLKIDHPTWLRAMEAIGDAITVTGSCTYYRVYERDEKGEYHQLSLDFSGV